MEVVVKSYPNEFERYQNNIIILTHLELSAYELLGAYLICLTFKESIKECLDVKSP